MSSKRRTAEKDWDRRVNTDPFLWMAEFVKNEKELLDSASRDLDAILANISIEQLRNSKVLDLGCGIGRLSSLLAKKAHNVLGVDISGSAIAHAQKSFRDISNLTFMKLEKEDLSDLAGGYDLIVSFGTLPHLTPKLLVLYLSQIRALLSPDGIAVLNLYTGNENYYSEEDTFSLRSYDQVKLARVFAALGFGVKSVRPLPLPFDGVDHHTNRSPYLFDLVVVNQPNPDTPLFELLIDPQAADSDRVGPQDEEGLVLREVNNALAAHNLIHAAKLLEYWTSQTPNCAQDLYDALARIRTTIREDEE